MAELTGSAKAAHPDAIVIGPGAPESITVTIVPLGNTPYDPIVSWLSQHGAAYVENGTIKFTADTPVMEAVFDVELNTAELPDGTRFRSRVPAGAAEASISIPDELEGMILAVLGLDNRPQAQPHIRQHAAAPMYTAQQVAALYNFPTDVHGEGQCVAVIELGGGYSNADLQAAGVNPSNVYFVGVDGATNGYGSGPGSADGEVALDLELIGQIAPACRIGCYMGPNTDQGFYDAIAAAVHDATNKPSAISISWGSAEANFTQQSMTAMDALFGTAAAAGIPTFAAAGDNGSGDGLGSNVNAVDFPASAKNCVGCGGTIILST